jgi:fluoride ion exporter CrcB/FEX
MERPQLGHRRCSFDAELHVGGAWGRLGDNCAVLVFGRRRADDRRDLSLGHLFINIIGSFVIGFFCDADRS